MSSDRPRAAAPARAAAPWRALLVASLALTSALVAPAAAHASTEDEVVTPAADGIVVVGTGGLHWTDVDRTSTPTLWRMISEGSVASISVRTVNPETCPLDAWLTLSAGRRTLAPQEESASGDAPESDDGTTADDAPEDTEPSYVPVDCPPVPEVAPSQAGAEDPSPHDVADWSSLTADPAEHPGAYGVPGTIGERIAEAGTCTTAVGPGAALALADTDGHVERYVPDLAQLDDDELVRCPVTMVDLGELPYEPTDRRAALDELDDVLHWLVDTVPAGWRVVVAGVSDTPVEQHGLQVVVDWHQGGGPAGWLVSDSTRRPGIITLADLAATAAQAAGAPVDKLDGSPFVVDAERRMSPVRTVENRRYLTEMTNTIPHLMPVFVVVVGLAGAAAVGALLLARRRAHRLASPGARPAWPGPVTRRVSTAVLLLAACAPAGAYLAALSRWWGWSAPMFAATLWSIVATLALALGAWGLSRLLPPSPWRLGATTAGLTWLVLTVDGLTGTVLQQGSILGATPTLGARYYGFGNTAFSVYAASALVLAGALAALLLARGRRRAALGLAAGVGVVTTVVDGWPAFGADFGGILALVPAFVVLLLGVAGATVTAKRALGAAAATLAVVGVVAVIDWARPGTSSHLGQFVDRVLDGEAYGVLVSKASGAWATVANPLGALATVAIVALCLALVGPERFRPDPLRRAYETWPLLRPVVTSVVVAAAVGTVLNDSGIVVAGVVLLVGLGMLAVSWCGAQWFGPATGPVEKQIEQQAPLRRMPGVLLATGGGLLATLLLAAVAVPAPPPLVAAGDVTSGRGTSVTADGSPVVVVGTGGVRWADVSRTTTPTLWGLLRDGASAAGVAVGTSGANGQCPAGGWLSLSSGRGAVTGERVDGTWECAPWTVTPGSEGDATVEGWADLVDRQSASEFNPELGVLASSLGGASACTTAVGPGAALALAGPDGTVERYRDLETALRTPAESFACPVTIVDAGAAPYHPDPESVPAALAAGATGVDGRDDALRAVDTTVRRVLQSIPADATVIVVDTGNPAPGRPSLGIGLVDGDGQSQPRFLSAASTRWEGAVRLLDLPTTLLGAVDAPNPPEFTGAPLVPAGPRPTDAATAVDQLAELTVRDHTLRGVAGSVTTVPLYVAIVLLAGALVLGPRLARRSPTAARRARSALDGTMLVLASLPAGLFLMTTWSWWRFDDPGVVMWLSLVGCTAIVAGLGALAPWRPAWVGPALISGITFAVLTLDAVLGTPLHRGSPLGPAPTLGGRYYGFGNPTYSVYVVAALITAAALATWLLHRGRRRAAIWSAIGIGAVALIVDLWPTLGADVGGGLVLVPAAAIVVLAVADVRVTWTRLALIGIGGVAVVAAIGIADWLRPAAERTHLGLFVQSAIDGTAWETIARKGGYAAATVTNGIPAWVTLALVIATALVLWGGPRMRPRWFERVEEQWPLVRPVLVGLLIAAVGGAIVNDYGVRIATVMLVAALPLMGMLALRSTPDPLGGPAGTTGPGGRSTLRRPRARAGR